MTYTFLPMDEKNAEIVAGWCYEPPYDVYSCNPEDLKELIRYMIDPANHFYTVLDEQGDLIAFRSFGSDGQVAGGDYSGPALDTGGGLRPDLTGRGLGLGLLTAGLEFGRRQFAPPAFRVTIARFNLRAQKVCERAGFHPEQIFQRDSDGKEFIILVKEETDM